MRRRRVQLTDRAEADLQQIIRYIRRESGLAPSHAVRLRIRAAIKRVGFLPNLGKSCEEFGDPRLRFVTVYSWLIIYDAATDPVTVMRILHAARDAGRFLR